MYAQDDNPFLLKRGVNEFGFWAGFSPKATTIFEGLRDDEAEDRRYGDRSGSNRGLNHFVIYAGFSIFR